jgi:hypothetical protein
VEIMEVVSTQTDEEEPAVFVNSLLAQRGAGEDLPSLAAPLHHVAVLVEKRHPHLHLSSQANNCANF